MKTIPFLLIILIPLFAMPQQPVDGPYVFEKGDSLQVFTIMQQGDQSLADRKMAPRLSAVDQALEVMVPVDRNAGFQVKLRARNAVPSDIYAAPSRLFIVSDIEGEFLPAKRLLMAAGVMDEQYNWIFGNGHLVIAGDLFDRGSEVLPWLWLLYSLEEKAMAAGGQVHVILGNHDIMQLSGDYRYTDARYFKHAWLMGRSIRAVFDESSILGRWLRTKNVVEKIGDLLVLHAGVSPKLLSTGMTVTDINNQCKRYYGLSRRDIPDSSQFLFDNRSPFWYRGYFMEPKQPMALVDSTLQWFNCKRIVVGHTVMDSISSLYDGKVIGVDVNHHEGKHEGLLIEANGIFVVDAAGGKRPL
ncbi:metallophosphoesterase [Chitinophaga pinensis]|nr:metallophosphoesterase [Chitinophaga pinensis]